MSMSEHSGRLARYLIFPTFALVWIFTFEVLSGVEVPEALRQALFAEMLTLLGSGIWILLRRSTGIGAVEAIGMGIPIAILVTVAVDQALIALRWGSVSIVALIFCTVIILLLCLVSGKDVRIPSPRESLAFFGVSLLSIFSLIPIFIENSISSRFPIVVNGDAPYREAVSASLHAVGPLDSLILPGGTARYHWFGNAFVGLTDALTDASAFVIQTRLLPLLALITVFSLAWVISARISPRLLPRALAAMMGVFGGALCMGWHHSGGALTEPFGISTTVGVIGALGVLVAWQTFHTEERSARMLLAILSLSALTLGARVSSGAVVVIACISVPLLLRIRSRWSLPLIAAAGAAIVGGSIALGILLFPEAQPGIDVAAAWHFGASQSFITLFGLIPLYTNIGLVVGTVAALAAIVIPLCGVVALPIRGKLLPIFVWSAAALACSIAGLLLTYQAGYSEFAFLGVGMLPLLVLSGTGAGVSFNEMTKRGGGRVAALCLISGILLAAVGVALTNSYGFRFDAVLRSASPFVVGVGLTLVAFALSRGKTRFRYVFSATCAVVVIAIGVTGYASRIWVSPLVGKDPLIWSQSDVATARWVEENTSLSDVIATNRQCNRPQESPPLCGSTIFNISGLAHRRSFVEGATYSIGTFNPRILDDLPGAREAIALSSRFGTHPDAESASQLWNSGVRYFWVNSQFGAADSWAPFAHVTFRSGDNEILRLHDPSSWQITHSG